MSDVRYTGHSQDHYGLQGHSVGDHYPYVLVAYETDGDSTSRVWGVIGPGRDHGLAREEAVRDIADATDRAVLLAFRRSMIARCARLYAEARGSR
ncbi:hypothetical protein UFOVP411_33 [uncultured Caudovirales phage]|uniref:Uncharacterized protein n=1 Tax=uncultured Caudovirales phage TaxID=2100421 RepID=A0A6J5M292_9CAUD|nr:hypothetical protein UFOVP411_33 [uncultured Caudovirales phage]